MLLLQRVVVTGVGLVSPIGVGARHCWNALKQGKSGVRLLDADKYARLPCRLAATVPQGLHIFC